MTDLETALQLLAVEDPFNGLSLEGYLSLRPDHRYGALAILRVGGRSAPQRILATPKMHYPFDRAGTFRFPPVAGISIYEKLDGTNVLAYRYRDAEGELHTTYKLRLFAVLRNSKWGSFLDMWREILARYPAISSLPEVNGCAVSFEMYGARNAHLVLYETPLDCAVLFGLREDGTPLRPHDLDAAGVPTARLYGELDRTHDAVAEYNRIREAMERGIEKLEDDKLRGEEGTVWYVTTARSELVSAQAESVEAVHWAGGINMKPSGDVLEPPRDRGRAGLRDARPPPRGVRRRKSTGSEPYRRLHLRSQRGRLPFRQRVLESTRRSASRSEEDKGAVMRGASTRFKKSEMKKVYSLIARSGGG
jgi:hypothetical protein